MGGGDGNGHADSKLFQMKANFDFSDSEIRPVAQRIYEIRTKYSFRDTSEGDWFRAIEFLSCAKRQRRLVERFLKNWEGYLSAKERRPSREPSSLWKKGLGLQERTGKLQEEAKER